MPVLSLDTADRRRVEWTGHTKVEAKEGCTPMHGKDKTPRHGDNEPVVPRALVPWLLLVAVAAVVIIILGLGGNL